MEPLKPKLHLKNLDGIRAIAAIMVILSHFPLSHTFSNKWVQTIWEIAKNGGYGVQIFFVLSGFLISRLIINDNNFNLSKFYLKRILRIWPLYYLVLLINFFAVLPLYNVNGEYYGNNIWQHLFFLSNFNLYEILVNGYKILPPLQISWSVSIEEQFYLFWPLIFIFIRSSFGRIFTILILITIGLITANEMSSINGAKNFTTAAAVWDLGVGGLLAFLHQKLKNKPTSIPKFLNFSIYILILILLSNYFKFDYVSKKIIHVLCFSYFIFEQCSNDKNLFQLDKVFGLAYLGKISYGIYMLHPICFLLLNYLAVMAFGYGSIRNLILLFLSVPFIFFIAHLSYKYFETYFLKLKAKLD